MTPGNQFGLYRTGEDVDIVNPYVAGYVVKNFQTGEWNECTINVPQAGTYRLEALSAVGKAGISLTASGHVLRINANAEYFNLDAIRIIRSAKGLRFDSTEYHRAEHSLHCLKRLAVTPWRSVTIAGDVVIHSTS